MADRVVPASLEHGDPTRKMVNRGSVLKARAFLAQDAISFVEVTFADEGVHGGDDHSRIARGNLMCGEVMRDRILAAVQALVDDPLEIAGIGILRIKFMGLVEAG